MDLPAHGRALTALRRAAVGAILAAATTLPLAGAPPARGARPEVPLAELHLSHWTKADGLPTDTLLDVHRASSGHLWVSGFGGLARFDGVQFDAFNQQLVPELEASGFYEVLDHDGALWIATQDTGVWRLRDNRFSPVGGESPRDSVRCLLFDSAGVLWAGMADRGALRLVDGRFVPARHAALSGVTVPDILQSSDGALWFATEGKGLSRLARDRLETFTTDSGLADDSVTGLWEDHDGTLWIATQSGLSRFRDGALTTLPELEGVQIFHVAGDDHGSIWIAAEQGLYRRNGLSGRIERLAEYRGVSLRSVNGLAFDHEGSVWVSSYTSGLFQLREGSFANWTRGDGLATERVNSVYERRDGSLLIGGDLGVIQVLDGGEPWRLELAEPLPEVRVRGFLEDSAGTLWIASYAGVLRLRGNEQTLLAVDNGLPTNRARFVYEDRGGRLWVGTRDGGLVALLDDGGFESLGADDGLASDFVLSLAEDRRGNLLVGTQNGLSVIDRRGGIVNYTTEEGLPGRLVFNIHHDRDGAVWLATTGGLARLLDGRIAVATVRHGLPAESVYDIAEDDRGGFWLTSSEGVIQVARSQLEELFAGRRARLDAQLFDAADGMADPQCTGATRMVKARDGSLWIPTLGGLARIDPASAHRNPVPPPVTIDRVAVDGEIVAGLHMPGSRFTAPAGAKNFEFRFAALSFQAPSRVEVRYRLEGFDDDWIDAGLRRQAFYTGLPHGEYLFRVIAANRDGVWNSAGASFELRVLPRFHETPAFFLLAALAVIGAPWTVYRWRLRGMQRGRAELVRLLSEQRRLEAERSRLIAELELRNEQLENLTHAVSHDLKSPLFTIRGFVGALENDLEAGDRARVDLDLGRIREAATYMGRILDQLNRVRRIELSETRLEWLDLGEVARDVLAAVAGILEEGGIQVSLAPEMPRVLGDRLQLTELLQNLVDNAARFMGDQPRPRIDIGWRRDGDETVYFVRDNGIGLEDRYKKRIFRLFQRLDPHQDGTGVGLTIVKRVVEAHHGRVWVESEGGGEGSTFCFTLPAQRKEG